jgi:hypothetical protein
MKQIFFDVERQRPARIPTELRVYHEALINNENENLISVDEFLKSV